MPILNQPTSNIKRHQDGFSLLEILVALVLAGLIFLAIPSGDSAQKHRELKSAVEDLDRAIRFAANESILRNTVVRVRLSLDKVPLEYTVEYGPAGNLPLPEPTEKTNLSLQDEKKELEKKKSLDREFTKVQEFEEIKHEIHMDVSVLGMGAASQKKLQTEGEASIYFFPTGEKDAAIIFFSTTEEMAFLKVEPFLSDTRSIFEPIKTSSVAKLEDLLQTRMDEVYKEWMSH